MLTIFAIGATAMLVLCCVPLVMVQLIFHPVDTYDKDQVESIARKVAPRLVVPPEFEATYARSWDNHFYVSHVARFDHKERRGRLVIAQIHHKLLENGTKYEVADMESTMRQFFPGQKNLDSKQSSETVLVIDGQNVTFEIASGVDVSSSTKLRQVSGSYSIPRKGAFQLLLQGEVDFVTEEAIKAMIDSLGDPLPEAAPSP